MKTHAFIPAGLRFVALIAVIIQCQCSHYYYAPPLHNVPTLKEKNDLMVSFSGSLQEHSGGLAVQTAVSPYKHIVVSADYNYIAGSDHNGNYGYYGNGSGNLLSLGAGYYHFYPNIKSAKRGIHLMALSGMSFGSARNDYYDNGPSTGTVDNQTGESHLNFSQVYIQPSLAWVGPRLELIFSARYAGIHYSKVDFISYNGIDISDGDFFERNRNQFSVETAWTLRAGRPSLKFQVQMARVKLARMPLANVNYGVGLLYYPRR